MMQVRSLIITIAFLWAAASAAQRPEIVPKQEGHLEEATLVCFSPSGRQALSAGRDGRIVLWDLDLGRFVRFIEAGQEITGLSFTPDGLAAVALLEGKHLASWSLETGVQTWSTSVSTSALRAFDFSPDRNWLAAGEDERTVAVWDLRQGKQAWQQGQQPALAGLHFSADSEQVIARSEWGEVLARWQASSGAGITNSDRGERAVAPLHFKGARAWSAQDRQVQFFDYQAGTSFLTDDSGLLEGAEFIQDFAFFEGGAKLAIALGDETGLYTRPGGIVERMSWGEIWIWDVAQNREIVRLNQHMERERVNALALAPDGRSLLSASDDRSIRHWALDPPREHQVLARHTDVETHYAFAPDFRRLALTRLDGAFMAWDWAQRGEPQPLNPVTAWGGSLYNLAQFNNTFRFAPDGTTLAAGWLSGLRGILSWWDSETQQLTRELAGGYYLWAPVALDVSPDGKRLLVSSGSHLGPVIMNRQEIPRAAVQGQIFDAQGTAVGLQTAAGPIFGQFSYDQFTYYGSDPANHYYFEPDPYTVTLWDMETGACLRSFPTVAGTVRFSPDGRLALADGTGGWSAWGLDTGRRLASKSGAAVFHAIHFQADSAVALTIEAGGKLAMWDVYTGEAIASFTGLGQPVAASFHPDGSTGLTLDADGTIREWDARSGRLLRQFSVQPLEKGQLAYAPNGQYALAWGGGVAAVIDLRSGTAVLELGRSVHPGYAGDQFLQGNRPGHIRSFEWLPSGDKALSASYDGTIRLWDLNRGMELATLYLLSERDWTITTPQGLFDASPGAMGQMYYRVGATIIDLEQLKERYYEPGLLPKLLGFVPGGLRSVEGLDELDLPPLIAETSIENGRLRVRLEARSGGIGKVALLLDGNIELSPDVNPGQRAEFEVDLQPYADHFFPDEANTLALRAYNYAGWLRSTLHTFEYFPDGAQSKGGSIIFNPNARKDAKLGQISLYALIVGTSKYSGDKLSLKYPDLDAIAFENALRATGNLLFEDKVHTTLLTTSAEPFPRKEVIARAIQDIASRAQPQDILLVYLSGHGITYPANSELGRFHYLTTDVLSDDLSDAAVRRTKTIPQDTLMAWMRQVKARNRILILDACNSGQTIQTLFAGERSLNSDQRRALEMINDRSGMFILAGSAADKASFEASTFGHGLLTFSLLNNMPQVAAANEKRVEVGELFKKALEEVPVLAQQVKRVQKPEMIGTGSYAIGLIDGAPPYPLPKALPVFLRTSFLEKGRGRDNQRLGQAVNRALNRHASDAKPRLSFWDIEDCAGDCFFLGGEYQVQGALIEGTAYLYRREELLDEIPFTGRLRDLDIVAEHIVAKAYERMPKD
jgi:WD40 repeat protein